MPHLSFTLGIDRDLVLIAREDFAEGAHADERAGVVAYSLLEAAPKPGV